MQYIALFMYTKNMMLKQIFTEHKYIVDVINSCETEEQLESTRKWYIQAVSRWDFWFENVTLATYYRKYYDIITYVLKNIEDVISEKKSCFTEKTNVPKIKGFKQNE